MAAKPAKRAPTVSKAQLKVDWEFIPQAMAWGFNAGAFGYEMFS
jgi:hypothetical protein